MPDLRNLAARARPVLLDAVAACREIAEALVEQARPPRPPAPSPEAYKRAGFWARMNTCTAARSAFDLAEPDAVDGPINLITASQEEVRAHVRRLGGRRRIHCDPAAITWEATNQDNLRWHKRRRRALALVQKIRARQRKVERGTAA